MLAGDRRRHATSEGEFSRVRDARNVPKPVQQPRVPIMVGGNGPNVTWRLAARHADELNLDGMTPDEVEAALPTIRQRCEEIGRYPATLKVSVHLWAEDIAEPGQERVDRLGGYQALGVARAIGLIQATATDDEALPRFVDDAKAAGLALG
jgi:alkanesulfonate monooxygenase SsuD/methylene tetrahydromethanopterin reductase-like flavin-dependent oxidoreductase (luciferase family)